MDQPLKKILVFIDWYLPGYRAGGPIKSCVSMVERLSNSYNFRIVTSDTDLNETQPYNGIHQNQWNILPDGTQVFYCSRSFLTRKNIETLIREEQPDVIYLNSMFSLYFTLIPLVVVKWNKVNCKVVVAPRGMLSKGALALKPGKKKLFLAAAKFLELFNNVTFHASTEIEVAEIKSVFGNSTKIIHAINLTPDVPVTIRPRIKSPNKLNLVYVGRISKVKNLLQCIRTLSKTAAGNEIQFDIYGPHDDADYYEQCKKELASLPKHIAANLKGPTDNARITEMLGNYHFLFLLSHNENYGHAIVEGFTAGCPVIIGNRTPWKNLEQQKCGWDLPLEDDDKITAVLNNAAEMNQSEYNEWSAAASAFARQIHENKKTIEDHHLLFSTN